jgi:hypothetical protein
MKIKKINIPLFILAGLLVLSFGFFAMADEKNAAENIFLDFDQDGLSNEEEKIYKTDEKQKDTDGDGYSDGAEVKSGYDPLKKAPGDKLFNSLQTTEENDGNQENLTEKIAKSVVLMEQQKSAKGEGVSEEAIQLAIDNALNEETETEEHSPEITAEDLKIIKQDYSNLSDKRREEKRKEDFLNYLAAVFYITSSNSSSPITSATDAAGLVEENINKIISSLVSQNSNGLSDLVQSSEKIYEQMKAVEVPEEMVEAHIKALKYIKYSIDFKGLIDMNAEDPMLDLINYSKLSALVQNMADFYEDIREKMEKYDVEDADLNSKIEDYGLSL